MIQSGPDLFGGKYQALNITGANGLRLYGGDVILPAVVDVDLCEAGTNQNLSGIVCLAVEGAKGLALVLSEAGNTDALKLIQYGPTGDLTSNATLLKQVNLNGQILDGVWYHLHAEIKVEGDAFTINGRITQQANGTVIGSPLTYTGSLLARKLPAIGKVGMVFDAAGTSSKVSFTNFAVAAAPAPTPTPTPVPDPTPVPVPTPTPTPVPGAIIEPISPFTYGEHGVYPPFVGGPHYLDPIQGGVGDCYLIAVEAATADTDPQRIIDMIVKNADGTYTVRFYKSGVPKYIIVTPRFPLWGNGQYGNLALAFNHIGPQREIWACLVEKAYAVFARGNDYMKLAWGWMSQPFNEITNALSMFRSTAGDPLELVKFIQDHRAAGHAVTAASDTHGVAVVRAEQVNGLWYITIAELGSEFRHLVADFQARFVSLVVGLA